MSVDVDDDWIDRWWMLLAPLLYAVALLAVILSCTVGAYARGARLGGRQ